MRHVNKEQLINELRALRRIESRYHQLLNEMNDGYVITRRDQILFANRAAAEMLDCSAQDLTGRSWKEFFEPAIADYIEQTPMAKLPPSLKVEILQPDGGRLAAELSVRSATFDDELAEFSLVRDITQQIQRDTALRESEEKYRTLFESSPESITLVSLDGTILDCNEATAKITGLTREQLVGKALAELGTLPAQDLPYYGQLLAHVVNKERARPLEVEIVHGDGKVRWLEAYPVLVKKEGRAHAIQVISRDITEHRLAEDALRQRNQELAMLNRVDQPDRVQPGPPVGRPRSFETGSPSPAEQRLKIHLGRRKNHRQPDTNRARPDPGGERRRGRHPGRSIGTYL